MPTIPSDQDLRQLPLRGVVCYAVRILKRLEPEFYKLRHKPTRIGVEELLKQAEAFCRGDDEPRKRTGQLAVNQVRFSQQRLSSVAYMAGSIGWGISKGDPSIVSRGLFAIASELVCMRSELQRDFEQLRLFYGRATDTETPVEPSETGPLGPLWDDASSLAVPIRVWDDRVTRRRKRHTLMAGALATTSWKNAPEVLIQAAVLTFGDKTTEGQLVTAVALPWFDMLREIKRDPDFLFRFVNNPRKFEEFIAGAYEESGAYTDIVLTRGSGDRGRDVILTATVPGAGEVHFVDEVKAYSPGRKVTAKDVSRLAWVLQRDQNVSKGIVTTTSDFAPGVLDEFKSLLPGRLELKDGKKLRQWLLDIEKEQHGQ